MKRLLAALLAVLFTFSIVGAMQGGSSNANSSNKNSAAKRGPIFRATKEQIKQAQAMLKHRGFYTGEQTGKLDTDTRAGLKKYQEAESLKVTGTLNKATLEKMSIPLTDKQKTM